MSATSPGPVRPWSSSNRAPTPAAADSGSASPSNWDTTGGVVAAAGIDALCHRRPPERRYGHDRAVKLDEPHELTLDTNHSGGWYDISLTTPRIQASRSSSLAGSNLPSA